MRAWRPHQKTVDLLERVADILAEYDFPLTLRQLFYRLVAAHVLPNTEGAYGGLSSKLVKAREAGIIDPEALVDRTRSPRRPECFSDLSEYAEVVRGAYRRDKAASQPLHVEAWVEKDALVGLFEQVTEAYDVYAYACRGYNSFSALWEAAMRFRQAGKPVHVLYFGDFDPSGLDMTRDIRERLGRYCREEIVVQHVALTKEQVAEYDLPPMPAKTKDTRAAKFIAQHGEVSAVELDALPPDVLQGMVTAEIEALWDLSEFQRQQQIERAEIEEWQEHLAALEEGDGDSAED